MKLNRTTSGWPFILPGLLSMLVIVGVPLVAALMFSMRDVRTYRFGVQRFIGFENYQLLFADSLFWRSIGTTLTYTLGVTLFAVILGFIIAMFLGSRNVHNRTFYITLFLLPFVTTTVVNAIAWRLFVWEVEFGLVNYLLSRFSLPTFGWLIERNLALPATIATSTWRLTPLAVLILYAAYMTIPYELIESAIVDGAGRLQVVLLIVLPLLKAHILFISLVIMTSAFRDFGAIFALTGGGPGRQTSVLSLFVYNRGISTGNLGYASAAAFVMFLIAAVIAWAYIRLFQIRQDS